MDKDRARAITAYLARVARARKRGDATEHTYRAFLQELVEALAQGVTCTNEPKGTKAGHPDLKVSLGETPLGYIETKDIGADLDSIVETSQLRRYLKNIPNLILTDYLEFRWFQNGSEVTRCRLGAFSAKGALRRNPDANDSLSTMVANFTQAEVKTIGSPKELAQRMAALAKLTRKHVVELFASEERKGDLHSLLRAFREVLLPDLDEQSFADMYAQTVCYGLFASICNSQFPQQFARENAADNLPATNPFLRRLFHHIVGPDLHSKVREDIERVVFLLKHADIGAILKDFGKRTRQEDPVVHFYETFLAEYDPRLRKSRGVYYTPEPVVSYIVRSVDWLLKEKFGKKEGLADPSVIVLDPACGTGTFLYSVIKLIHERVESKGQYGAWNSYVRNNLLPRIFGFELLMAPYAVAHLKLGLLLKDTGYDFSGDERLGVYLTNTLEQTAKQVEFEFAKWLSEESVQANQVKNVEPVLVVLGNPPYAGYSANANTWVDSIMAPYKVTVKAEERQIQRLSNDYVKFFRFAQWRIDKTGCGVLGFVSDRGYLDGILFRDMRASLMGSFDLVHLLDLHGVAVRGESKLPDSDANVFDITQGVAIGLFTKTETGLGTASPRYAELIGPRERKYQVLSSTSCQDTAWKSITPKAPRRAFVPEADSSEYDAYYSLLRAIGTGQPKEDRDLRYGTGIKTRHDEFVIGWSSADAVSRVRQVANRPEEDATLMDELHLCTTAHFDITKARARAEQPGLAQHVMPIVFRPFDQRCVVYLREFVCEPKAATMSHMLHRGNMALAVLRRDRKALGTGFFVATGLIAKDAISNIDDALIVPLYVFPGRSRGGLFESDAPTEAPGGRRPNLSPDFIGVFSGKLGLEFVPDGGPVTAREQGDRGSLKREIATAAAQPRNDGGVFGPEDVFNYIYAVFHSPTYRKRYAEFLKIDFPRVPLTSDVKLFRKLCALGAELVALHLMESPALDTLVTRYPAGGNNAVERVSYNDATTRVYINEDQYFEGIRPEEFEFHIGGYQVLDKWLKDRKKAKRKLSDDDVRHYQRIVVAIRNTIRLMTEIDKAIPKWPIS